MLFARPWLLPQHVFDQACTSFDLFKPTDEQVQAFIERRSRSNGEELFTRGDDGTARIPIIGMLTKEPSFFFDLFGGGSSVYGDIVGAIHTADGDPDIKRIVLEIDSVGGDVDGFFDLARAVRLASTRIEAEVTDNALSAAFGIAVQADKVTLNNPLAKVGSVGVVTRRFVDKAIVRITSTAAPLKAPDADTPEGIAAIKAELDAIHAEFVTIIAQGRSAALGREITAEQVNADFGRGAIILAREAVAASMVDGIDSGSTEPAGSPAPTVDDLTTGASAMAMDLTTFRTENRDLYDSIRADAREEGVKAGMAQERDRVTAHVTAGYNSRNLGLCVKLIAEGADFASQTVQAQYLSAGQNAAEALARSLDDGAAPAAPAGPTDTKAETAAADAVAAGMPDEVTKSVFANV